MKLIVYGLDMNQLLMIVVTIFALILVLTTTSFAYNKEPPPDSATNTYFIAFESHVDKNVIKAHGGETIKQFKYKPVVTAKLSDLDGVIKLPIFRK